MYRIDISPPRKSTWSRNADDGSFITIIYRKWLFRAYIRSPHKRISFICRHFTTASKQARLLGRKFIGIRNQMSRTFARDWYILSLETRHLQPFVLEPAVTKHVRGLRAELLGSLQLILFQHAVTCGLIPALYTVGEKRGPRLYFILRNTPTEQFNIGFKPFRASASSLPREQSAIFV